MAYNLFVGRLLHVCSVFAFLFSLVFVSRRAISIWTENLWMIPIFLFGIPSAPYVAYSIRSYGEVFWKFFTHGILKEKYKHIMEEYSYKAVVLPSDCDVFNHMNNSRYSREVDFARLRFYSDSGLINFFHREGKYWIMVASVIRYRRSLEVFQTFDVTTKIISWDEKNVYLEHKFLTTDSDGSIFINAIIVTQMRVLCKDGTEDFLCRFLRTSTPPEKPEITEELQYFLKYIETNRRSLRYP